jgi:hypothetical protein
MKTPEPTNLDPDYYPRIKHNRRWYLIVPEIRYHEGCAFECPGDEERVVFQLVLPHGDARGGAAAAAAAAEAAQGD